MNLDNLPSLNFSIEVYHLFIPLRLDHFRFVRILSNISFDSKIPRLLRGFPYHFVLVLNDSLVTKLINVVNEEIGIEAKLH